jgi:hypothetical protein
MATNAYGEKKLSDAWSCQSQCQSEHSCNFVQWNNSTRMCQFFNGDIEEIYKDPESILGARDCNNIASLWKKKPIATTTTTTTTPTTTTQTTSSPSKDTAVSGAGETTPPQNETATRYICHYRERKRKERLLVADSL